MTPRPEWDGLTVVCIASGPGLNADDCELIRRSGHPAVVTNTTFRLCQWADALYAFDTKWWRVYHEEVKRVFKGRRFGGSQITGNFGAEPTIGNNWFRQFTNSGACAISLAMGGMASRVILTGYDLEPSNDGRNHWHDDHPEELGNLESVRNWPRQFELLAMDAKKKTVQILNASRVSALTQFERVNLKDVL